MNTPRLIVIGWYGPDGMRLVSNEGQDAIELGVVTVP
jgi:hypothetical protein